MHLACNLLKLHVLHDLKTEIVVEAILKNREYDRQIIRYKKQFSSCFFYLFKKINFKVVLNIIHFILTALKLTFISVGYIDLRNVFKPSIKLIS